MKKPITPAQALNNFWLLTELSPQSSFEDYRAAVNEIANAVIASGIQDRSPVELELREALQAIIKTCEAGVLHRVEAGKPPWSALPHIQGIARAAISKATP